MMTWSMGADKCHFFHTATLNFACNYKAWISVQKNILFAVKCLELKNIGLKTFIIKLPMPISLNVESWPTNKEIGSN